MSARTKKVHKAQQVAHLWAHQSQPEAYTASRNFSFGTRGDSHTLYSYSTAIARMIETKHGRVALLNERTYSNTTTRQMSEVQSALRGLPVTVFFVPEMGGYGGTHELNLKYLVAEYAKTLARELKRIKWYSSETHIAERLQCDADDAFKYACIFDLQLPVFDVAGDALRCTNRRTRLENDPKAIARRAATAAKNAREDAEREARRAERDRVARLEAVDAITMWRAGHVGTYSLPYAARQDDKGGALLRIVDATVQTSLGAEIPLEDGRAAYEFIKTQVATGHEFTRLNDWNGPRVGAFQIDHVALNGDIKAGCHFIQFAEIERLFA